MAAIVNTVYCDAVHAPCEKSPEITAVRTSGLVNPVFFCQTGFSSASICLLINRWLQLSPLYILSTGPLRLGSKVYPSNMQRMLHKGFTRFKQSLSRTSRSSKQKKESAGGVKFTVINVLFCVGTHHTSQQRMRSRGHNSAHPPEESERPQYIHTTNNEKE